MFLKMVKNSKFIIVGIHPQALSDGVCHKWLT